MSSRGEALEHVLDDLEIVDYGLFLCLDDLGTILDLS